MQPSARQQELERLYNSRRGHIPHISISDDNHHVTEAIGSYYGDEQPSSKRESRPLSFIHSPTENNFDPSQAPSNRKSKREGSYFDMKQGSPPRVPLANTTSNEKTPSPTKEQAEAESPKRRNRMGSTGSENHDDGSSHGQSSSPALSRQSSKETAIRPFPLSDIDYESSPAAVAQELSNLQAIRRMSMNVDTADPDLPSFSAVQPGRDEDEDDTSRLYWVPARLHPELAPKEFKTFIDDRVDKIRRTSGESDSLSPDGMERSNSNASSLRRKKSMLSHQIDTKGNYQDGAERLERKRSKGMSLEGQREVELNELGELVGDPAQVMRRMSLDTARKSQDSGVEVPAGEDMPILPPVGQSLKRSTRTTYRRGSLKKGERVPFSKRAQQRHVDSDDQDTPSQPGSVPGLEESAAGLTRVQTEPAPAPVPTSNEANHTRNESGSSPRTGLHSTQSSEELESNRAASERAKEGPQPPQRDEAQSSPPGGGRKFHSRLASGGRTSAQLPGYNNTNPLPNIIETLPDGTKVPVNNAAQAAQDIPERKSSREMPRPFHRGGAHARPVPGREHQRSSTLDDISSHPSPLPGSGGSSTDALTMVPTFGDEKKAEKKDGSRKSSWKSFFGNDDEEKKSKEDKGSDTSSVKSSKVGRLTKQSTDKTRFDVLQNSIDGGRPSRDRNSRESLVLSREDIKLEEERKKEGKKSSEGKKDKEKDTGLLSAIFGGKKKTSDGDLKEKKRRSDRNLSPDPAPRILKPDIDYNWTRFSILEERAIYRMAHIKLANPRRALYSQVLLSNFMYSYLAKVQMMHPQVQIPAAHQKAQQQRDGGQKEEQQQQPAEYSQYQRWQQQQEREREQPSQEPKATSTASKRSSFEIVTGTGDQQQQPWADRSSYDYDDADNPHAAYDPRSSEEYEYDAQQQQDAQQHYYQQQQQPQQQNHHHGRQNSHGQQSNHHHGSGQSQQKQQQQAQQQHSHRSKTSGAGVSEGGRGNYSVAQSRDYLGYPKGQQPFDQRGPWDEDDGESGAGGGGGGRGKMW